jgi:lactoylglutathione lyase
MILKNDHTAFQVSNLDQSIEFYTQSIGLNLMFKGINKEEQEAYAFLELEGGNLELIQKLGSAYEKPALHPPYCPHFAIETNQMNDIMTMIERRGIRIVKGPLEIKGKERWIYIADPDNNVIEYIEWASR